LTKRKYDFAESDKVKVLLWCARHCCLCGRQVGIGIEVAHLRPDSPDLDNAIPLCFNCHAEVGRYNREHPLGRNYSVPELKARRDQVYEEHTRHLVPPVRFELRQGGRKLPDVGFNITNLGDTYPVKATVRVTVAQADCILAIPDTGHYNGRNFWNLNPSFGVDGHFAIKNYNAASDRPLRARIEVTLMDIYGRKHDLLPVGYVTMSSGQDWYLEPSEEELAIPDRRGQGAQPA
jgi:hypothetical protein